MDNDSTFLKPRRGSVWLGLVLGVLLTVLYLKLGRYVSVDPIHWLILLAAFQWIYILPLFFILRAKRHPRTAIGLLIVGLVLMAAIVALFMLNLFPHAF
jgi:heme/copper-type cytochrome/quinol oxidase subunit 4